MYKRQPSYRTPLEIPIELKKAVWNKWKFHLLHIDFLIASDYNEMVYFEREAGRKEGVQAMEFDHGRALPRWFVLTGDIHIEMVDKFSGGNVHPDRVMSQWVLVLMSGGERTFRI